MEIFFAYYKFTYSSYFLTFWNSLYVYTRGILGCLLGFWPLGQNPAGAIIIIIIIIIIIYYYYYYYHNLHIKVYRLIINPRNDLLPVGLIAQLVEYCTGITEVRVWIPVPAWIFLVCPCCLSSDKKLGWSNSFIPIYSSLIYRKFLWYHHLSPNLQA